MAHPSSSHRDREDDRATLRDRELRDRERERERRATTVHHHRTISSTTLLLVLSLILAVLAVMLSLPSRSSGILPAARHAQNQPAPDAGMNDPETGTSHGFWGYLTPKRSHALVSRESNVALREAEVARREAEILLRPVGYVECPACPLMEEVVDDVSPSMTLVSRPAPVQPAPVATTTVIQEVIKEVTKEVEPAWLKTRVDGLVEREMKIADREKEIGQREETIGKRESDATKREGWIMEQISALHPEPQVISEPEYVYEDAPRHYYGEARRPSPPKTVVVTATETITSVVPPAPTGTSLAAHPIPETFVKGTPGSGAGKTREVYVEHSTVVYELPQETVTVWEKSTSNRKANKKWFGNRA